MLSKAVLRTRSCPDLRDYFRERGLKRQNPTLNAKPEIVGDDVKRPALEPPARVNFSPKQQQQRSGEESETVETKPVSPPSSRRSTLHDLLAAARLAVTGRSTDAQISPRQLERSRMAAQTQQKQEQHAEHQQQLYAPPTEAPQLKQGDSASVGTHDVAGLAAELSAIQVTAVVNAVGQGESMVRETVQFAVQMESSTICPQRSEPKTSVQAIPSKESSGNVPSSTSASDKPVAESGGRTSPTMPTMRRSSSLLAQWQEQQRRNQEIEEQQRQQEEAHTRIVASPYCTEAQLTSPSPFYQRNYYESEPVYAGYMPAHHFSYYASYTSTSEYTQVEANTTGDNTQNQPDQESSSSVLHLFDSFRARKPEEVDGSDPYHTAATTSTQNQEAKTGQRAMRPPQPSHADSLARESSTEAKCCCLPFCTCCRRRGPTAAASKQPPKVALVSKAKPTSNSVTWEDADARYNLSEAILTRESNANAVESRPDVSEMKNNSQAVCNDIELIVKSTSYRSTRMVRQCTCSTTRESATTPVVSRLCPAGSSLSDLTQAMPWATRRCDILAEVYSKAIKLLIHAIAQEQNSTSPEDASESQTYLTGVYASIILKQSAILGLLAGDEPPSAGTTFTFQNGKVSLSPSSSSLPAMADVLSPRPVSDNAAPLSHASTLGSSSSAKSVTDMDVTLFTERSQPVSARKIQDYNRIQFILRQKAKMTDHTATLDRFAAMRGGAGAGVMGANSQGHSSSCAGQRPVDHEAMRRLDTLAPGLAKATGVAPIVSPLNVSADDLGLLNLQLLANVLVKRFNKVKNDSLGDSTTDDDFTLDSFSAQLTEAVRALLDPQPAMSSAYLAAMREQSQRLETLASLFASQALERFIRVLIRTSQDDPEKFDKISSSCLLSHVINGLVLRDLALLLQALFELTPASSSTTYGEVAPNPTAPFPTLTSNSNAASQRLRVQIASDLHIETYGLSKSLPKDQLMRDVIIPAAPVLGLLGDIGVLGSQKPALEYWGFLRYQAARFKLVLVLSGNHEFYCSDLFGTKTGMQEILARIHAVCVDSGAHVIFMDRESVVIPPLHSSYTPAAKAASPNSKPSVLTANSPGVSLPNTKVPFKPVRIAGCSLWSFVDPEFKDLVQLGLNDYHRIHVDTAHNRDSGASSSAASLRQLLVADTMTLHKEDVRFLFKQALVASQMNENLLVLTHHAPTFKNTSNPMYEDSPLASAFATDLEWLMAPKCSSQPVRAREIASLHAFLSHRSNSRPDRAEGEEHRLEPELSAALRLAHSELNGDFVMDTSSLHTWCSGHTHWSNVSSLYGVRIVSNQHGYVDTSESTYDPSFVIAL